MTLRKLVIIYRRVGRYCCL